MTREIRVTPENILKIFTINSLQDFVDFIENGLQKKIEMLVKLDPSVMETRFTFPNDFLLPFLKGQNFTLREFQQKYSSKQDVLDNYLMSLCRAKFFNEGLGEEENKRINREIIKNTIRSGANPYKANVNGYNVLALAAGYKNLVMIECLLDHDRNILNSSNNDGFNALHNASQWNHLEAAELLVKRKINLSANTLERGFNALHIAAINGRLEVVNFLVKHISPIIKSKRGFTPLYLAVEYGHLEVVKSLAAIDPQTINMRDNEGFTPIIIAAQQGHLDVVEFLLKNGADLSAKTLEGARNALHLAVTNCRLDVVDLLLKKGFDVNSTNSLKLTALHLAVSNNDPKMVKLLIRNGADIEAESSFGSKAIDFIRQDGGDQVRQILLIQKQYNKSLEAIYASSNMDFKPEVKKLIDRAHQEKKAIEIDQTRQELTSLKLDPKYKDLNSKIAEQILMLKENIAEHKPRKLDDVKRQINQLLGLGQSFSDRDLQDIRLKLINFLALSPDLYPQKEIQFIQQFCSNLSILKTKIAEAEKNLKKLENPIALSKHSDEKRQQIEREIDEKKLFIEQARNLIGDFSPLVFELLLAVSADLSNQDKSEKEALQLEQILADLRNINKIFSGTKIFKLIEPKPATKKFHAVNLENLFYLPEANEADGTKLAQVFISSNLNNYNQGQLDFIQQNILQLGAQNLEELIRIAAINLVKSPQKIIDFKKAIPLIPEHKKEIFRNALYDAYNRFGSLESFDLNGLADFLLIAEDLFDNPSLTEEEIAQLKQNKIAELNQSLNGAKTNPDTERKFIKKTRHNLIIKHLNKMVDDKNFIVILDCKAHGKQAHNPHISKTPQQKLQANLATTEEQLQEKLGGDFRIDADFLKDLVEQMSDLSMPIKRGRTSGSHYGNLLPKILPNLVSPLNDNQKQYYKEALVDLQRKYLEPKQQIR